MKSKQLNAPEVRGIANLEKRELSNDERESGYIGVIRGEIPFDSDSQVMRRTDQKGNKFDFVERITSSTFARSLSEDRDIIATAGHEEDPLSALAVIGRNLSITTDERSMKWEALLPDTHAGRDMMKLVEMGIITGTSFEFLPREGGEAWEKRSSDGLIVRTITDARLMEVNPVKWPAYLGTSLTVEMRGKNPEEITLDVDLTEFRSAETPDEPEPPVENDSLSHWQRRMGLIDKTAAHTD